MKSVYRTTLSSEKKTALLKKIKKHIAVKVDRVIIAKGSTRYYGQDLTSITIDETLSVGTLVFNYGAVVQTYDKADIIEIRRLRTRKYKIVLHPSANPAI